MNSRNLRRCSLTLRLVLKWLMTLVSTNPKMSVRRRPASILERETGVEPATSTLARLHSTTELFPLAPGSAERAGILPGDSGECQGGRPLGGPSTGLEGVADQTDAGRRRLGFEDLHHVEPARASGRAAACQIHGRRPRDPGAFAAIHRLRGLPEGQRRAR